ncbi:MAG: hypothetical protein ACOCWA_02725, partial [Bacteroidota bacterium]
HREIAKRESYDAAHLAAACCVLNGGRLMPYFVEGMWMKGPEENGLLALFYSPNELNTTINGVSIKISEQTHYPFSDNVKFIIQPESPVEFSLTLRKPHACQDVSFNVPDRAEVLDKENRLIVKHRWNQGDEVNINFNFEIKIIEQPSSKTVKDSGVYLKRGALVYALPFEHNIKKVKEYRNSGFYRYNIKAKNKNAWNYSFLPSEPVEFVPLKKADNVKIPWDEPETSLKVWLVNKNGEKEEFELVPMGSTIFRRVTFPVNYNY